MSRPESLAGLKFRWDKASGNHQGRVNSVNQVDGVSDMPPPAGSVAEGSSKEQWPLPALPSGRKLYPPTSSYPDAGGFCSSPYFSGSFQAAASELELRVSESG